jgi:hypothetical protein
VVKTGKKRKVSKGILAVLAAGSLAPLFASAPAMAVSGYYTTYSKIVATFGNNYGYTPWHSTKGYAQGCVTVGAIGGKYVPEWQAAVDGSKGALWWSPGEFVAKSVCSPKLKYSGKERTEISVTPWTSTSNDTLAIFTYP